MDVESERVFFCVWMRGDEDDGVWMGSVEFVGEFFEACEGLFGFFKALLVDGFKKEGGVRCEGGEDDHISLRRWRSLLLRLGHRGRGGLGFCRKR